MGSLYRVSTPSIYVVLTPTLRTRLEAASDNAGVTISALVRRLLDRALPTLPVPTPQVRSDRPARPGLNGRKMSKRAPADRLG